jgi:hypothetical protein
MERAVKVGVDALSVFLFVPVIHLLTISFRITYALFRIFCQ